MTLLRLASRNMLLKLAPDRTTAPPRITDATPWPAWISSPDKGCAPERGKAALFTSEVASDLRRAVDICLHHCPFLRQCDELATANNERHHVWGGRIRSSNTPRKDDVA